MPALTKPSRASLLAAALLAAVVAAIFLQNPQKFGGSNDTAPKEITEHPTRAAGSKKPANSTVENTAATASDAETNIQAAYKDLETATDLRLFVESLAKRPGLTEDEKKFLALLAKSKCLLFASELDGIYGLDVKKLPLNKADVEALFYEKKPEQFYTPKNYDAMLALVERCQGLLPEGVLPLYAGLIRDGMATFVRAAFGTPASPDEKAFRAEEILGDDELSPEKEQQALALIRDVLASPWPAMAGEFFAAWRTPGDPAAAAVERLAWQLAACDLGEPGCAPGSNRMLSLCATSDRPCDRHTDYRGSLAGFHRPAELNAAELRAQAIVSAIRARRFDELLDPATRCTAPAQGGAGCR